MEPNPYQPPLRYARLSEPRFSLEEGRLLVAVLAVGAATVVGVAVGAIGGVIILASMPRESMPACGNTVLDPMALAGAAVGLNGGLWFSWRRICREARPNEPT